MSTRRRTVTGAEPPKRADGARHCRFCDVALTGRKRTFCGEQCVHEWRVRSDPSYARTQVWKRDRGFCALCGADTNRAAKILALARDAYGRRHRDWPEGARAVLVRTLAQLERHGWMTAKTAAAWRARDSRWLDFPNPPEWEMDHAVPVCEGGGEVGLGGLRTLCAPCHRRVTRELAERRRFSRALAFRPRVA